MKLRAIITGLFGRDVETDVWPVEYSVSGRRTGGDRIPEATVRRAVADRTDAELFAIAATVIEGWIPILLPHHVAAMTDVHVLVGELRNRSAMFEAIERDAAKPFLDTHDLGAAIRMYEGRPADPTK